MNFAWQTYVVFALTALNTVVALVAANTPALGITSPWVTLIAIPAAIAIGTLAANQMKTIGTSA